MSEVPNSVHARNWSLSFTNFANDSNALWRNRVAGSSRTHCTDGGHGVCGVGEWTAVTPRPCRQQGGPNAPNKSIVQHHRGTSLKHLSTKRFKTNRILFCVPAARDPAESAHRWKRSRYAEPHASNPKLKAPSPKLQDSKPQILNSET